MDIVTYALCKGHTDKAVDDIMDIIASMEKLTMTIVDELPSVEDAEPNVIYLIDTNHDNVYEEYVLIEIGGEKELVSLGDITDLSNYYNKIETDNLLAGKQATLTWDNVPTENSTNAVNSGVVYAAVQSVANTLANLDCVMSVTASNNVITVTYRNNTSSTITITGGIIPYDNTTSGLSATNVQSAIDEVAGVVEAEHVSLTQAQYDQLTPAEKNNGSVYFITDGESSGDFSNLENRVGTLETSNQTAVHYKGVTTTALADGDTTNPITINGTSYTAVLGDVVAYSNREFVFDGTAWSEFGRPFDTTPTSGSANAVTSDGVYRYTAGQKEYTSNMLKGEIFNTYTGSNKNVASGNYSHAEGNSNTASGNYSHAEGNSNTASGNYSHAEGFSNTASKMASHVEGGSNTASGAFSHAEGFNNTASGANSHAGGENTIATAESSTVIGRYNVADGTGASDPKHLFIIGNGSSDNARSNILEVSNTDMNVNGDIQQNGAPIRATTMPTITASMLGKVVQYVGVSDSNYKQGWNYVAVSDGASEPTYSWQALMDSVPTSGSNNPVTSDGIYKRTPFERGTGAGVRSAHLGTYSSATGQYSIAVGYYSSVSGESAAAFGDLTRANQKSMLACGQLNNPRTGDLFNIGNGINNNQRSNIVEVNRTSMNVNGDIQKNGVSFPTPYTTMPTITSDMLGQIAMYVGETTNDYVKGCFYIAATDGAAEPTYSWVRIGSGRTETVLWENEGTTNPNTITLSEAYTNFDELVIANVKTQQAVTARNESTKHTSALVIGEICALWLYDGSIYGSYTVTSSTVFTKYSTSGDYRIQKIIGIKY